MLCATTWALGTTASLGSVIVPVMDPVTVCAQAMGIHISIANATTDAILSKFVFIGASLDSLLQKGSEMLEILLCRSAPGGTEIQKEPESLRCYLREFVKESLLQLEPLKPAHCRRFRPVCFTSTERYAILSKMSIIMIILIVFNQTGTVYSHFICK